MRRSCMNPTSLHVCGWTISFYCAGGMSETTARAVLHRRSGGPVSSRHGELRSLRNAHASFWTSLQRGDDGLECAADLGAQRPDDGSAAPHDETDQDAVLDGSLTLFPVP